MVRPGAPCVSTGGPSELLRINKDPRGVPTFRPDLVLSSRGGRNGFSMIRTTPCGRFCRDAPLVLTGSVGVPRIQGLHVFPDGSLTGRRISEISCEALILSCGCSPTTDAAANEHTTVRPHTPAHAPAVTPAAPHPNATSLRQGLRRLWGAEGRANPTSSCVRAAGRV